MGTKPFITLIVAVLVLGGSIGGAFAAGISVGSSQDNATTGTVSSLSPTTSEGQASTPAGQFDPATIQQQLQSGELDQDDLEQLRQQFLGQGGARGEGFGGFGGGGGFAGGGRLTGTIESIDDGTVIINTPQGPLQATVVDDTTIRMTVEGVITDLQVGTSVSVLGERSEDGTVEATSIIITPEGGLDTFGADHSGD